MSIKIELEFVPVAERLPEESGKYLCINGNWNQIENHCYSARHKAFNVRDGSEDDANSINEWIVAWAKMPDLSKAKEEPKPRFAIEMLEHIDRKASEFEQQRRRDMFERICIATIDSYSGKCYDTAQICEAILKNADKFARGE